MSGTKNVPNSVNRGSLYKYYIENHIPPLFEIKLNLSYLHMLLMFFATGFFFLSSSYLLRNAYVVRRLIYKDEKQCRPLFKVAAKNVGQRTCVKW